MIAIDLGSNTLRVLAYDCQRHQRIADYSKVVKTADGLAHSGVVSAEAMRRVIEAIQEAQQKIDFTPHTIRAVTTEAVRRATNSDEVLAQIRETTGIAFEIITGEEEASLTLLAVKKRLALLNHPSKTFAVIDIGGGSTEIIFHYEEKVFSQSFPIGIVTMAQSYESLEEIRMALPLKMQMMKEFCDHIYATHGRVETFVGTAGTPTSVASMKLGMRYATYDASEINGTVLAKEDLDFYLDFLLSLSFEEREITVGTGRSDLVTAGILIYKELFSLLDFQTCVVVDDGLREGVALGECV